jgi:hypothetical protein
MLDYGDVLVDEQSQLFTPDGEPIWMINDGRLVPLTKIADDHLVVIRDFLFGDEVRRSGTLDGIRQWGDRASVPRQLMAELTRADWRPPTDQDWRRLRTLLRDVRIFLEMNAEDWEQAEQDVRTIGGESWSIGIGRYPDRAARPRELATWVEEDVRALRGGHQRPMPIDDCAMLPGRSVP